MSLPGENWRSRAVSAGIRPGAAGVSAIGVGACPVRTAHHDQAATPAAGGGTMMPCAV
jgi:hypothetical protein